jgi:hypothetical protein
LKSACNVKNWVERTKQHFSTPTTKCAIELGLQFVGVEVAKPTREGKGWWQLRTPTKAEQQN